MCPFVQKKSCPPPDTWFFDDPLGTVHKSRDAQISADPPVTLRDAFFTHKSNTVQKQ